MLVSDPGTCDSDWIADRTAPLFVWSLRSKSIRGVDPNVTEPTCAAVGEIVRKLIKLSEKTLRALNDEPPMLLDPSRTKTKSICVCGRERE